MKQGIKRRMTKIRIPAHMFKAELYIKAMQAGATEEAGNALLDNMKSGVDLEVGFDRLTGKVAGIKIAR